MKTRVPVQSGPHPGSCHGNGFLGVDTVEMGRTARVVVSFSVLVPVMASGLFLVVFFPQSWWIFTIYGWVVFPALGLLGGGLSTVPGLGRSPVSEERRLLEAMERVGPLTPARAAVEASLSVSEAEGMLDALARNGHVRVAVRDGGLFYSMWDGETVRREVGSP